MKGRMKKEILKEAFTPILHPYQATIITTVSKQKRPNAIAIAWIIPVSIKPPALAFAIRKQRFTYKLLKEVPEFVVNIVPFELAKETEYVGSVSGVSCNKLKDAKLKTENAEIVLPPVIKKSIAHIECRVKEIVDLSLDHVIIVGEVLKAFADNDIFEKGWKVKDAKLLLHLGGSYFTTNASRKIKV